MDRGKTNMNLLAQQKIPLKERIGGEGLGPFGNIEFTSKSGITGVVDTISAIVGFMTIAAAIWFLFQILYGGYQWLSSGGDSKAITSARDRLTHAFIGLTIVVGAWALLSITGAFFGTDAFINPASIIEKLKF